MSFDAMFNRIQRKKKLAEKEAREKALVDAVDYLSDEPPPEILRDHCVPLLKDGRRGINLSTKGKPLFMGQPDRAHHKGAAARSPLDHRSTLSGWLKRVERKK